MILGLYKHYKGSWCFAFGKKRGNVVYLSFKNNFKLVHRPAYEFFNTVPYKKGFEEFRYLKFTLFREPCYCRELDAYQACPRHGMPKYRNHMILPRFDGHEHERKLSDDLDIKKTKGDKYE